MIASITARRDHPGGSPGCGVRNCCRYSVSKASNRSAGVSGGKGLTKGMELDIIDESFSKGLRSVGSHRAYNVPCRVVQAGTLLRCEGSEECRGVSPPGLLLLRSDVLLLEHRSHGGLRLIGRSVRSPLAARVAQALHVVLQVGGKDSPRCADLDGADLAGGEQW